VARKWALLGAEGGDVESMLMLEEMLKWGMGGLRDPEGALSWEARATDRLAEGVAVH